MRNLFAKLTLSLGAWAMLAGCLMLFRSTARLEMGRFAWAAAARGVPARVKLLVASSMQRLAEDLRRPNAP